MLRIKSLEHKGKTFKRNSLSWSVKRLNIPNWWESKQSRIEDGSRCLWLWKEKMRPWLGRTCGIPRAGIRENSAPTYKWATEHLGCHFVSIKAVYKPELCKQWPALHDHVSRDNRTLGRSFFWDQHGVSSRRSTLLPPKVTSMREEGASLTLKYIYTSTALYELVSALKTVIKYV